MKLVTFRPIKINITVLMRHTQYKTRFIPGILKRHKCSERTLMSERKKIYFPNGICNCTPILRPISFTPIYFTRES